MAIRFVLLDADGVVQRFPGDFIAKLSALTPKPNKKAFLDEVFAAEHPYMEGGTGFPDALAEVLRRWHVSHPVDQVLQLWTDIEVDAGVVGVVKHLRKQGIRVALATNQQETRARYMEGALPYRASFDHCFYSCFLGAAKPDSRFFQSALASLGAGADEVLFVDDSAANVQSAAALGMRSELFPHFAGAAVLLKHLSKHGLWA
jgi:putative hydrolase of the HAD superfamily